MSAPAQAQVRSMAFKQAMAEAAASDRDLAAFYRARDYAPLWVDGAVGQARRQALFEAFDRAPLHGLPASRYPADALYDTLREARTARDLGFAEVALSRGFLRLAHDMQSGLLNPSEVVGAIKRERAPGATQDLLSGLSAAEPNAYMRRLAPQTPEYRRLLKARLDLEGVIAAGGWGDAVPGQAVNPGDTGARVIVLRNRLIAMGYLDRTASAEFDRHLQAAVRRFQVAHGLEADGVAGRGTLDQINVTPEARLQSVHVALERERWLNKADGQQTRQIRVNLTDFTARVLDKGVETFRTRAVVGKDTKGRRSPEFSDEMEFMVINPTWHVPRSIAVKEYLPKLRRNRYAVGHLKMVNSRGQVVSRDRINFSAYGARSFPYAMKQPPSDNNALGLVKFMFPNQYNIYLHDTPHKDLFTHETRAYSHGCIRLADPFGFAYHLLARQEADPKGFFHTALDTGSETKVMLDIKIPVHIIYRTAFTDAKTGIQYRRDVYGRDAVIWQALRDAGVSLTPYQG
ncbi:MAG: L,D-transpeptidase family protein [Pseudomonadota bacterium]